LSEGKTGKLEGNQALSDVGVAFATLVFIYSFAVVLTLNFRPLYYLYLSAVGWPELNMSPSEIMANYEALIAYNSIFFVGPLDFPTLDMSSNGRVHYEEVKRIFVVFQIALAASVACLIPTLRAKLRRCRTVCLTIGGFAAIILAATIVVYLGLDWERFFVRFHETFFNNDYWMFDAVVDPSILILPNGYFMACAVMIFCLVLGLSVVSIIVARRGRTRRHIAGHFEGHNISKRLN
jgi:integral membrane protein (TIGR01906 family)